MAAIWDLDLEPIDEIQLLALLFIREPILYISNIKTHIGNNKIAIIHIINSFHALKEAFDILNSQSVASSLYIPSNRDTQQPLVLARDTLAIKYKGNISILISY